MLIGLLVCAALALAYANGANDNFKATATVYGSGTLGYKKALILASMAQIAGSLASVLLAGALLKVFSGKGLVPIEVVQDPIFLVSVGAGAAGTVLIATRFGIPVSTTHSLIGGLVGASLAMAPDAIAWGMLGGKYFTPLLVSPLLALVGAALLYPVASFIRQRMGIHAGTSLRIGGQREVVEVNAHGTMVIQRSGLPISVEDQANCERCYSGAVIGISAQTAVDSLHIFSAFSLGFARGLNDTPKVLALLVAAGWSGINPRVSLAIVAFAMVAGGLLHSRRLAETLGHKITTMNCGQGMLANLVASCLVIGASLLGSPVSTTHVSTGAIFGIGVWTKNADWKVAGGIVLAWVATLPIGALLAYVVNQAIAQL
jgi:PiT family inorganic phosphate transporter